MHDSSLSPDQMALAVSRALKDRLEELVTPYAARPDTTPQDMTDVCFMALAMLSADILASLVYAWPPEGRTHIVDTFCAQVQATVGTILHALDGRRRAE